MPPHWQNADEDHFRKGQDAQHRRLKHRLPSHERYEFVFEYGWAFGLAINRRRLDDGKNLGKFGDAMAPP